MKFPFKFFFHSLVALAAIQCARANSECSRCRETLRNSRNSSNNGQCHPKSCRRHSPDSAIRRHCDGLCRDVNQSNCNNHQACTNRGLCFGSRADTGGSCNNRMMNKGYYYYNRYYNNVNNGNTCSECRTIVRDSRKDNGDCNPDRCRNKASKNNGSHRRIRNNCNGLCHAVNHSSCNPHQACTSRGFCAGNRDTGGSCNNRMNAYYYKGYYKV